jgi:predicted Zn-dependent protease
MQTSLSIPLFQDFQFDLHSALQRLAPQADWVGLRLVEETTHMRSVRNKRPDGNSVSFDRGVMIEVLQNGHFGYAGTSDLSVQGLNQAFSKARELAQAGSQHKIFSFTEAQRPQAKGQYQTAVFRGLDSESLKEFTDLLMAASRELKASDKIVTALASARIVETRIHCVSSNGTDTLQEFLLLANNFSSTAQAGSESQTRSANGGVARCLQMGLEAFDKNEILQKCSQVAREALLLLEAPNCPSDTRDLILAPDQMLLQIHESIGHPLELDRILGDERNYAGSSFVKASDFGNLKYGSDLMNVTFDPSMPGEYASYAFDDCGNPAQRQFLIEKGVLKRGLGSLESQVRSNLPGVANFRSASWNRAPIDRMANINMEPGQSSLKEMISQTEKGIYMEANISWSIDDYRNKFQFGCEYARLIENGELTGIVKNPNYRGVTVPFWNSLKAVGSADEVEIYGTPWCGKGEPSQVIRVGHAAPPCLFEKIEVFGGGK